MSNDHLSRFGSLVGEERIDRARRPAYVAGLTLAFAGLVLGAAYGGPAEPLSLFVAALLGGVLYQRVHLVQGAQAYGNILIAGTLGSALSSLAISGFVSLALGIPIMNVIWATGLTILANVLTVSTLALTGFVVGVVLAYIGGHLPDSASVALLALGTVGFLGVQYQIGAIRPDMGGLATPILSGSTQAKLQLYQIAGLLSAAVAFVGLLSLLRSRRRRRLAVTGVILVGIALGGIGIGSVGAEISTFRTTSSLADQLSIEVTEVDLTGEAIELSVRIHNPTDRGVRTTGFFARAASGSDVQIAYGAGDRVDTGPSVVRPGKTVAATYRIRLTPTQAERLRAAIDSGEVTISGEISFRLANQGAIQSNIDTGFGVPFECALGPDGVRC